MQNNSDISNSTGVKPERSPIITVLFFFGIVINIVSAIMTTTDYYIYEAIEYEPFLTVVCQDIINVVSLILLLYWKSIGFYLYAINTLIAYIVLVTLTGTEYELFDIIRLIISIIVLYAILNIKEEGISYWKAMKLRR
ncbi:MAG: hypothetical protein J6K83_00080 [Bacteroidaceae bacterium]|nr:hypothetical protein [Bacteroidaceae bacterium]